MKTIHANNPTSIKRLTRNNAKRQNAKGKGNKGKYQESVFRPTDSPSGNNHVF